MPEAISPEQLNLRDRARAFARDILLAAEADCPSDQPIPPAVRARIVAAARDAGLYPMTQPKAFGGTEADTLSLVVAKEAIYSQNPRLAGLAFGPGPGVLAHAEGPLVANYLEPQMRGEKRGSFGFTEPDHAPHFTRAVPDGDSLIVTGAKSYVTGGADADFVNALVEIEGQGKAMVVIDRQADGVVVKERFNSLDGSHHAYLAFEGVRVPASNVIGQPGEGLPRALAQIGDTRLSFAAEACGLMLWIDDFVSQHLSAAHPSGTRLGDREGVRLRFAEARMEVYLARAALYRTARLAVAGENTVNEGIITKVYCTEAVGRYVDSAIQLVGGRALINTHPLAKLYQSVRALRLAEGASDVLRINLIRGHLDLGKGRL